ncbi:MAG: flagellar hook-length control protein FliK, partial [Leptospirales bacterium]
QNEKDLALDGTKTVDRVVAGLPADLKETILSKNKGGAGQDQNKSDSEKSLVKGEGAASAKAVIARDAAAAVKVGNPETMNATELARFAERVAAAKSELQKKGDRREAQSGGEAPPGAREAKIDAASGGLRVELDSAKWQLNGRAYGERGGQDNTESRVAGLMDRYVKGRGANAKDSGERGNESGREQQRGDTRSFANRLSDLQIMNGGEVRDAGSQNPLDQARLNKEEVARENRRLFNDLVEKARVNVQSNGNSTASIKMNPAALGRMTLNLEVRQNQVHARILVDSDAAKRMLTDEMEHLRQELTRQGITVESLSIRVREPASMSFMEGGASSEQSTLEQPATGEEKSSDGSSGEAGRDGEDQSRRGSVDQAEQEYELAGAAASSERDPRRELSGVNISI